MPLYQYLTFLCEQPDLQALLTEHGLEGWRLHTCDPVVTIGPQGSGMLNVFVVMDRYIEPESEELVVEDDTVQEGIAMRG